MSGRKAKALRRAIYDEQSLRGERSYVRNSQTGVIRNAPGSLRAQYQGAKRVAQVGTGVV